MEKCYFDMGRSCSVLREKKCEGCSFYQSPVEFMERRKRAAESLKRKGLAGYQYGKIMTTKALPAPKKEYIFVGQYEKPRKDNEE